MKLPNIARAWRPIVASVVVNLAAGPVMADAMSDASAGWIALKSGDSTTAIGRFTNAIGSGQLSGSYLEIAYVKRGEAFLAIGDRPNALADAQGALALAPNDTEAIRLRVKALGAAPQGDIAAQAVAHNLRGLKFADQRDFADAASEFQQAPQLDPTQPVYAQNLRNAQTALSQAQALQANPLQSQTSTACKMELAKAGMNIFVGMVALAKGGASYQQQEVDSSQCQGQ